MRLSEAVRIYERESDTVENGLAAVLEAAGVELAPEPEPLPEWWGERLRYDEMLGEIMIVRTPEVSLSHSAPRCDYEPALALSHSLRVAAAELVREHTSDGYEWSYLVQRLRHILLGNELPESGGEQ